MNWQDDPRVIEAMKEAGGFDDEDLGAVRGEDVRREIRQGEIVREERSTAFWAGVVFGSLFLIVVAMGFHELGLDRWKTWTGLVWFCLAIFAFGVTTAPRDLVDDDEE